MLRWSAGAGVQSVWKFTDETVYSLLWHGDRLWVGTGLEGKLYSHQDERMMLEKDVDQRQIVALLPGEAGPAFATTNGAAFFRFTKGMERNGTLTSDVFDADLQSEFGTLHWRGVEPDGTKVRFSLRGGMSALPDSTWSDWSAPRQGHEISLRDLERSRYFQWRAELESASEKSPEVHAVEISYLQANQPPQLDELAVLDPGQILVPSNFNPANQVFEPAYPNREGIFTTLAETKDDARAQAAVEARLPHPALDCARSQRGRAHVRDRRAARGRRRRAGCGWRTSSRTSATASTPPCCPTASTASGSPSRTPAATTAPRERPRPAPARRW